MLKYPFCTKHSAGSVFCQITHDVSHRTRTVLKLYGTIKDQDGWSRRLVFVWLLGVFGGFLAALDGSWGLNSATRDQTQAPCSGSVES